jgi:hypothetical protein
MVSVYTDLPRRKAISSKLAATRRFGQLVWRDRVSVVLPLFSGQIWSQDKRIFEHDTIPDCANLLACKVVRVGHACQNIAP